MYNTSGTVVQSIPIPGNRTTSYTVHGLNEDTVYNFTVHASTRIGAGPSAELTARTHEYCMLRFSVVNVVSVSQPLHGIR